MSEWGRMNEGFRLVFMISVTNLSLSCSYFIHLRLTFLFSYFLLYFNFSNWLFPTAWRHLLLLSIFFCVCYLQEFYLRERHTTKTTTTTRFNFYCLIIYVTFTLNSFPFTHFRFFNKLFFVILIMLYTIQKIYY